MPGRLAGQQDVVAAVQRRETRTGDQARQQAAFLEVDGGIVPRMEHQRWCGHLRGQIAHVKVVKGFAEPDGVLRRGGHTHQVIEPAGLWACMSPYVVATRGTWAG